MSWLKDKGHAVYGAAQTARAKREIEQMRARMDREAEVRWELAKIAASAKKDER